MSRSERSFERAVTLLLLVGGLWYLAQMLSYPAGSGRIPAIVAIVMIVAAAVQLALSFRRRDRAAPAPALAADDDAGTTADDHGAEIEPDSYDTLIRLRGKRRRLFIAIAVWTVLFYVGSLAVGFVITFTVLFAALLLYVGEKVRTTAIITVVTALTLYAFLTAVLDLPAARGFLIG
jgi:hypothetical protein